MQRIATLPPALLNEARTVFDGGPTLRPGQKEMLEQARRDATATGLFAPERFPGAPSLGNPGK